MKFSRLFFISVLFCLIVSAASAFLMVRFIAGNVSSSRDTVSSAGISGVGTPSDNHVLSSSFTGTLSDLESAISQIANRVSPSVVSIIVTKQVQTYKTDPFGFFYEPAGTVKRQVGGGTGFFVSKEGYILTNKHVVSDPNAEYTILLADGRELIGKVLAYDPITDLAVIRAFKTQTEPYNEAIPLSFIESQSGLRIGSFVVAIGNALAEFQNTVTFGVVSGLGRQIQAENPSGESEALSGLIQTDAAINPGNSGGPLLNIQWKVVGINTAVSAGANGIGFALPLSSRVVDAMITSVAKYGQIKRPFLGIRFASITPSIARSANLPEMQGARVGGFDVNTSQSAVIKDSPADKAGIAFGDIILEVDGKSLSPHFTVREALAEKLPGDSITIKIWKKETKKIELLTITLGETR